MHNRSIATWFLLSSLVFLLCSITACAPSTYRVIIWNQTGQKLTASGHYSVDPINTQGITFNDLFVSGEAMQFDDRGKIRIVRWHASTDTNYFWIGFRSAKGETWVLNASFENYWHSIMDISEGPRIDYFIEPGGKIRKAYWQ